MSKESEEERDAPALTGTRDPDPPAGWAYTSTQPIPAPEEPDWWRRRLLAHVLYEPPIVIRAPRYFSIALDDGENLERAALRRQLVVTLEIILVAFRQVTAHDFQGNQ